MKSKSYEKKTVETNNIMNTRKANIKQYSHDA